ncbi:hypothetical protein MXB_5436 [Myxobolus squamalis]|nr:hypothetical protein MXB_5436 [Myxobolus squamalis]
MNQILDTAIAGAQKIAQSFDKDDEKLLALFVTAAETIITHGLVHVVDGNLDGSYSIVNIPQTPLNNASALITNEFRRIVLKILASTKLNFWNNEYHNRKYQPSGFSKLIYEELLPNLSWEAVKRIIFIIDHWASTIATLKIIGVPGLRESNYAFASIHTPCLFSFDPKTITRGNKFPHGALCHFILLEGTDLIMMTVRHQLESWVLF